MDKKTSIFVNIKKDYYSIPTQVRWGEMNDDGQLEEYFGIAYQGKIICACCGGIHFLDDEGIYVFEEFDWIDISDAIEGT